MTERSHKCIDCGAAVEAGAQGRRCTACGREWPVVNGVATYRTAKYFGELSQPEMARLLTAAANGHWRTAATEFGSHSELLQSIADLKRAAWIPLLPLGPESEVLDVGCGLGAITHALALHYERVVAIEPIAERVEFTRIRLQQERLSNVELIQTTVDALPFFDRTFDLVVLNGIVEWIGEWSEDRSPRRAQIAVLESVRRLLKPGGVVVIGIENRLGMGSFLGRLDHSGLRFTYVMPRRVASWYMKVRKPSFHRTAIDGARGYRTYTYGPAGYRTLLAAAGFAATELWWPPDGYNSPHVVLRLGEEKVVKQYCKRDRDYRDRVSGRRLRRSIKWGLIGGTGLSETLLPDDLVLVATNDQGTPSSPSLLDEVRSALARTDATSPRPAGEPHPAMLTSHPFGNKSVVSMVGASGSPDCIVKIANTRLAGHETVERSARLLEQLGRDGAGGGALENGVPRLLAIIRRGSTVASVETAAPGVRFQDLTMSRRYFGNRERVVGHLRLIVSWLKAARPPLEALDGRLLADPPAGPAAMAGPVWTQHGDFVPENIYLHDHERRACVIDWDEAARGYPPLFDWFCLVTGMYYTDGAVGLAKGETVDRRSFEDTYFKDTWFSREVVRLTHELCESGNLGRPDIPAYFQAYLTVRRRDLERRDTPGVSAGPRPYGSLERVIAADAPGFIFRVAPGERAWPDEASAGGLRL